MHKKQRYEYISSSTIQMKFRNSTKYQPLRRDSGISILFGMWNGENFQNETLSTTKAAENQTRRWKVKEIKLELLYYTSVRMLNVCDVGVNAWTWKKKEQKPYHLIKKTTKTEIVSIFHPLSSSQRLMR